MKSLEGEAEIRALEALGLREETILALAMLSSRRSDRVLGNTLSYLIGFAIARPRSATNKARKRVKKAKS